MTTMQSAIFTGFISRFFKGDRMSHQKKPLIGQFVIVRCRDAGVHAGTLLDYSGRTAVLESSRRLWYFVCVDKQHSLSGVANVGIDQEKSKIPAVINTLVLTETCEIISCTKRCLGSIMGAPIYEAENH